MIERVAAVVSNGKIINFIVVAHDAVLKDTEIEYSTIIGAHISDTVNNLDATIAKRNDAARAAVAAELVTAAAKKSAIAKLAALGLTADEISAL
jgi:hypothetical protein